MSIKQKFSKQKLSEKDRGNNRKFLLVMALVTAGLIALMYLAFAG